MTEEMPPPSPLDPNRSPEPIDDEDEGPVWIFPSWRWLYATVLVYTVVLVAVLHAFTVALDHGTP
jgi:hypothetical protein